MHPFRIEACVETLQQAVHAQAMGAHQIELCTQLDQDGLTPSRALIRQVMAAVDLPVKVMIRPRPGNFVYSRDDREAAIRSVCLCLEEGIGRIVTGALTPDGHLDLDWITALAACGDDLRITVHKAIDACQRPLEEVRNLTQISSVDSILSSGGAATARAGAPVLREMITVSGDRLTIIAAGRVTFENIHDVHDMIGASVYHGRRIVPGLL